MDPNRSFYSLVSSIKEAAREGRSFHSAMQAFLAPRGLVASRLDIVKFQRKLRRAYHSTRERMRSATDPSPEIGEEDEDGFTILAVEEAQIEQILAKETDESDMEPPRKKQKKGAREVSVTEEEEDEDVPQVQLVPAASASSSSSSSSADAALVTGNEKVDEKDAPQAQLVPAAEAEASASSSSSSSSTGAALVTGNEEAVDSFPLLYIPPDVLDEISALLLGSVAGNRTIGAISSVNKERQEAIRAIFQRPGARPYSGMMAMQYNALPVDLRLEYQLMDAFLLADIVLGGNSVSLSSLKNWALAPFTREVDSVPFVREGDTPGIHEAKDLEIHFYNWIDTRERDNRTKNAQVVDRCVSEPINAANVLELFSVFIKNRDTLDAYEFFFTSPEVSPALQQAGITLAWFMVASAAAHVYGGYPTFRSQIPELHAKWKVLSQKCHEAIAVAREEGRLRNIDQVFQTFFDIADDKNGLYEFRKFEGGEFAPYQLRIRIPKAQGRAALIFYFQPSEAKVYTAAIFLILATPLLRGTRNANGRYEGGMVIDVKMDQSAPRRGPQLVFDDTVPDSYRSRINETYEHMFTRGYKMFQDVFTRDHATRAAKALGFTDYSDLF